MCTQRVALSRGRQRRRAEQPQYWLIQESSRELEQEACTGQVGEEGVSGEVLITVAKEHFCQNATLSTWTGLVKFWLRALWINAGSNRDAIESTV